MGVRWEHLIGDVFCFEEGNLREILRKCLMLQLRPGGWVEMNWGEEAKMWHEKAPGRI